LEEKSIPFVPDRNPMFDSLRRWKPGKWSETSQPIEATLAEMDRAGVSVGMLCA
jgi:hypothetical protein